MTTEKQKKANRKNAKKSTGPQTRRGKAKVAKNAIKHGILSRDALLDFEDAKTYEQLATNMWSHFEPQGGLEFLLVEKLVNTLWRLKRISTVETGLFSRIYYRLMKNRYEKQARQYTHTESEEDNISNEILFKDLSRNGQARVQAFCHADIARENSEMGDAQLARVFEQQSDHLTKLSRYEAGLEKMLYKTFDELRKVQAARKTS